MSFAEVKYKELKGSHFEIGQQLGAMVENNPMLKAHLSAGGLDEQDMNRAKAMFDRWCPGLNEELGGFADALGVTPEQAVFYAFTYLKPGCSQIAVLSPKSKSGHVLLARNYEFSDMFEDFMLIRTCADGKYAHIGSSVLQFGRDEGINECGLAVTMSSCGFPVGADENMRRPAIRGLQFWAAVRALLENCKDVDEALAFIDGMPIAFNLNMIVADKSGRAALIETMEGRMEIKRADEGQPFLHATNHAVFPNMQTHQGPVMKNSIERYEMIEKNLGSKDKTAPDDLKALMLGKYPDGLSAHYYDDFFGTTKSIVMDVTEGTMEVCWGGLESNGWKRFDVGQPLEERFQRIELNKEKAKPEFFATV